MVAKGVSDVQTRFGVPRHFTPPRWQRIAQVRNAQQCRVEQETSLGLARRLPGQPRQSGCSQHSPWRPPARSSPPVAQFAGRQSGGMGDRGMG